MSDVLILGLVVAGAAVIVFVVLIGLYNALVRRRNAAKNAWSQIDVQLKRRHNLVPNLVETVKGYASHEKETLENVIQARSQAVSASGVGDQIKAEGELSQALGRLMMVVEQYPNLKADRNFLSLQEELTSTENKIGFARQHYNDSVMRYNNKTEVFPANVVAGMFNFKPMEFFEIEDASDREVPQVKF